MDTREEAIACGRAGAECAVIPYQLCANANGRYSARIATPFSRVASGVFDAIRERRRPNPMTPGVATRWGVGIYALPAERSPNADAIERVEIQRDGHVIQPLTRTVAPIDAVVADGSTRRLSRGFFTFPAEAFNPSAAVTIVFHGRAGETTCTLDRGRLSSLR